LIRVIDALKLMLQIVLYDEEVCRCWVLGDKVDKRIYKSISFRAFFELDNAQVTLQSVVSKVLDDFDCV